MVRDQWDRVITAATERSAAIAAALTACLPLAVRDDRLRLRPLPDTSAAAILDADACRLTAELLTQVTGLSLTIDVLDPGRSGRERANRQDAYRAAQTDPVIQDLLKRFDAEVIAREPSLRERWLTRHQQ